ncbi:hypothetical protein CPB85DRAFT_123994 [Mucidula mucida]|nr:hypothetical protein CPB85DRAFT_123994 [Mucidula mucida]
MFHTSSIKTSFQKLSKATGSGRPSSPKLLEKISSSFGRRSPEPTATPPTGATIPPPPPSSQSPEIASPFSFEAQDDSLETELLLFLAAIGTGDNPATFQESCHQSIEHEIEAVKTLSQMAAQQHQAPPPMASESTAMVEDRPRPAIRPIPRRARAAASMPAPSPFAFNDIPDYRPDIIYRRPTTPPRDAELEFMPGAELRHEHNLMETKDLIERERAKEAGQSINSHLFMPDLYNRLEAGTWEATAIMKDRTRLSAAQGAPPAVHSPAPASPGALPSSTSPQKTPQKLAKDSDVAGVAEDLGREAALAVFAAMRKEKTKFSTRMPHQSTCLPFSEDRSMSGIFKSSNPTSTRLKAVPMDEDKTKVEETKAADALWTPLLLELRWPPHR